MVTLLVDANLDGHAALLDARLSTEAWRELRDYLDIQFMHFEEAELDRAANDAIVWRFCQTKGYYLLTANRNLESDDSLEATIRREGTIQSLPVFTFSDVNRVYESGAYVDRIVQSLLQYLLDAENYRGTGRLFLP